MRDCWALIGLLAMAAAASGPSPFAARQLGDAAAAAAAAARVGRRLQQFRLTEDGEDVSFARFLELLEGSAQFRDLFLETLAASPYEALFFECVPVDGDSARSTPFEFVLVESAELARFRSPDLHSFDEHFRAQRGKPVAVFSNLGGDATLVVPQPIAEDSLPYIHLKSFVAAADREQKHQLLVAVARAMQARLAERPRDKVWLSTSGLGVPYLHVRLDDFPKYYSYTPYRRL